MKTFLMLLALGAPLLFAQDAKKTPASIAVALSDGSVLVSTGVDDALEIRTAYGDQKIPMSQIRSARRLPSGRFLVAAKGLTASGDLIPREFLLNTSVGTVRVAAEDLRSINVQSGAGAFQDEATAALWWFGDGGQGACRDRVKGHVFTFEDFDISEEAGLVSRKAGALGSAPVDADLEFLDQDYTLELRFRLPKQIRQYVMLLQKGTPADGSVDFSVYSAVNGMVYFSSSRTGQTFQTPPNILKREGWNTLTFVQKTQPHAAICYVNGKPVATAALSLPFGNGQNRDVILGYNRRFGGNFDVPEAIQFLRVSRIARGEEEIEEAARAWEGRFGQASPHPGVALRDGSFIRGEFTGLGPVAFRTRFGSLSVSQKSGGQVKVYKMRLSELEQGKTAVQELIAKLGSTQAREREAATTGLLALGEAGLSVLRGAEPSADPEIRSRVAELIQKLEESGAARKPACDVLQVGGLQVQGWLDIESIPLSTRRGKLQLPLSLVAEIHFGRKDPRSRPLLRLHDGQALELDPVEGSKVAVDAGFGAMSVPLEDLKELTYDAQGKLWTLTTGVATMSGRISGEVDLQTPVGTLKVPMADVKELKSARAGSGPAILPDFNEDR